MRATDPFRITARSALLAGWRELWRRPGPTLLALVAAVGSGLALRAASVRVGELADLLAAERRADTGRLGGLVLGLIAVALSGGALAALLADVGRAVALCAYGAPLPPDRSTRLLRPLRLGLARTPGFVSVRVVELLLYGCLAVGDAFVLALAPIHDGTAPFRAALLAATLLAPSLLLALPVFAATRVAQVLIARGLPTATALAHGYDVVARRFASLARLGLAGLLATSPLLVAALVAPVGLRDALFGLAALWLYAALDTVVGGDGRLVTG